MSKAKEIPEGVYTPSLGKSFPLPEPQFPHLQSGLTVPTPWDH